MRPPPRRRLPGRAALVALVALLSVLVTLLGPATTAEAKPRPEHHSKYDVKRINATTYLFSGTVSTYPKGTLLVLKQADGISRYTLWKKVPIRRSGHFSTRLTGSRGDCFRLRINQANGYRTTTENLGCIVPA